jgi:UDP-N-acetylmuramoylalanine--D-glutamate ligase
VADWKNKRVSILGFARSGVSTALYLAARGARIKLSDAGPYNESKAADVAKLEALGVEIEFGGHSDATVDDAELIVTSPGIPPSADIIKRAQQKGLEVICDIELVYRETKTPILAITGTNGKSTTTALTSFILGQAGLKAPACGNIGVPIFSQLEDGVKNDFLVVELSSFQLYYTSKLKPLAAAWINLTPDHLDWHGNLEDYVNAKKKIFANQDATDFAILNFDDPLVAALKPPSTVVPNSSSSQLPDHERAAFVQNAALCLRWNGTESKICKLDELQIIGRHNIENALAAVTIAAVCGVSAEEIGRHLKQFKALEHRLEFVATREGVSFYNDSKATNTDSAIKALEAFPNQKVVLIAGGKDKGTPLGDFVLAVRKHASAVILIGEAKSRFEKALRDGGVENIYPASSMEEAARLGQKLKVGPVLLSPACASFDMFKDFEDRGRVFKDIVCTRL